MTLYTYGLVSHILNLSFYYCFKFNCKTTIENFFSDFFNHKTCQGELATQELTLPAGTICLPFPKKYLQKSFPDSSKKINLFGTENHNHHNQIKVFLCYDHFSSHEKQIKKLCRANKNLMNKHTPPWQMTLFI